MTLDRVTGKPPASTLVGFLPPNRNPPEGAGSVQFTISPKQDQPTGTEFANAATITFDTNPPITTPVWVNTLDADKPDTRIAPLDARQHRICFGIRWSGEDKGAGIEDYTVLVAENGGPVKPYIANTANTSGVFAGTPGKTYAFYSTARDRAGNVEHLPQLPDTVTQIDAGAALADDDTLPDGWERQFGLDAACHLGPDGPGGDPDGDGVTNSGEYAAGTHPRGVRSATRHFAEGATGDFFDTEFAVLNADSRPATVLSSVS